MLNGWISYQTIVSRLYGRSGYYQSGGAYGFRDQLQDTLGMKYLDADLMKEQIIKHSKHLFTEGDDLLWLVYVVIEYIEFTGDKSILDIETAYLQGEELKENQDERYDKYEETEEKESI